MSEPKTVAIIMDGNRRWAKKNNLPIPSGHRKGIESLIEIVKTAKKLKIERLIVYAFSTENWSRDNFEVNALMNLINFSVDVKLNEIKENGIKLDFIGNLDDLPEKAQKGIGKCIKETKDLTLGGLSKIVRIVFPSAAHGLVGIRINDELELSLLRSKIDKS